MKTITFKSKVFGEVSTIIDNSDYIRLKELKNLKWCIVKKRGNFYFQKRFTGGKLIELHRWIMKEPIGFYVDHINNNTLDNRKTNLRVCSNAANLRNGRVRTNNKSGITGVRWDNVRNRWIAYIKVNFKTIFLGRFKTIKDAINARKEAEIKFFDV